MCHRREWFESFSEISTEVTIGDGTTIVARGRGDISILAHDGHEWICKLVTNVLYVPEIRLNLFSSGKAMDRGHQLRSNKRCELLKEGCVVAVGARRGTLFRMMFKVIEPISASTAIANLATNRKLTLQVWHERMGHQNTREKIFTWQQHCLCGRKP